LERKISEWLSTDALVFELVLVGDAKGGEPKTVGDPPQQHGLKHEWELLQTLLREQIENGTVILRGAPSPQALAKYCAHRAARSLCHCLAFSANPVDLLAENTIVERVTVDSARPSLSVNHDPPIAIEADDALEHWVGVTEKLLMLWV